MGNRLAEARTRSEGFTARVSSHLRLPPRSDCLHENAAGIMRTMITEALHIPLQEHEDALMRRRNPLILIGSLGWNRIAV